MVRTKARVSGHWRCRALKAGALIMSVGLSACGGGSGEDAGPDEPSPFTDPNQPIHITSNDALGIAGVVSESLFGGFQAANSIAIAVAGTPGSSATSNGQPKAVLPLSTTCPGGGTIATTWRDAMPFGELSVNDGGSLVYSNCSVADYQFNGLATLIVNTLQGDPAIDTNWQIGARVSFASPASNLQETSGDSVVGLGGGAVMSIDKQDGIRSLAVNADPLIQFSESDGYLTNLYPFNVTLSESSGAYQLIGSGTLSANYIGQVSFQITENLTGTNFLGNRPSGGHILIVGAQNKTILLRIVDASQVALDIDEDGDGTLDETVSTSWESMSQAADRL